MMNKDEVLDWPKFILRSVYSMVIGVLLCMILMIVTGVGLTGFWSILLYSEFYLLFTVWAVHCAKS